MHTTKETKKSLLPRTLSNGLFVTTFSTSIRKTKIKDGYLIFLATRDIKKGEILLEEEAFSSYYQVDNQVNYAAWANFVGAKELSPLYPRTSSETLKHIDFMDDFLPPDVCAQYKREVVENARHAQLIQQMGKIHANMFSFSGRKICLPLVFQR